MWRQQPECNKVAQLQVVYAFQLDSSQTFKHLFVEFACQRKINKVWLEARKSILGQYLIFYRVNVQSVFISLQTGCFNWLFDTWLSRVDCYWFISALTTVHVSYNCYHNKRLHRFGGLCFLYNNMSITSGMIYLLVFFVAAPIVM